MTDQLPPGSVIITPTKMYEELQDVGKKVDRLSAIIDPALARLREDVTENKHRIVEITLERKAEVAALNQRVRSLENWRWLVLGVAGGLGTAGGYGLTSLLGG